MVAATPGVVLMEEPSTGGRYDVSLRDLRAAAVATQKLTENHG